MTLPTIPTPAEERVARALERIALAFERIAEMMEISLAMDDDDEANGTGTPDS
jgi:hypothetical protein